MRFPGMLAAILLLQIRESLPIPLPGKPYQALRIQRVEE
jgi:hypothetical protein